MLSSPRPAPPGPAGRPRLIIDNPGPAARPRAHTEIIGVNAHDPRVLAPPPPKARGHGARLWLCWHCVPRDHRTHTLPERHCKQAMLARGRWQATFTRDTTVLLPRSCTGFFLHASMPSKAKSNSAGKKPMGSGMKQTTLVARRSVVSPSNGASTRGTRQRPWRTSWRYAEACTRPREA